MYSLKKHNSFGFDVSCSEYLEFSSEEELLKLLPQLASMPRPLLIIGSGSNVLFRDNYPGTVLHSAIKGISVTEQDDSVTLTCGSGETMDDVISFAISRGYYGAENLSLIPGEVGASAVQNIGAYGVEAKDIISSVRVCEIATGHILDIDATDCMFGYRSSRFKHEWAGRFVITAVSYRLSRQFTPRLDYGNIRNQLQSKGISQPTAQELRDVVCEIRRAKLPDPKTTGNAGSFFMNPVVDQSLYEKLAKQYPDMPHYPAAEGKIKIPAGWLIEQTGWKGRALGQAAVHDKQALVLINLGKAVPSDVIRLYTTIQSDVEQRFGIQLKPEVVMA